GSSQKYSSYVGNQKKVLKECVLLIDKQTGDIIIEKIETTINMKKARNNCKPQNTNEKVLDDLFSTNSPAKSQKVNDNTPPKDEVSAENNLHKTVSCLDNLGSSIFVYYIFCVAMDLALSEDSLE
ncbi:MAG: chromatin modification-related protein VID21, partial [Paramarteilia canceri]